MVTEREQYLCQCGCRDKKFTKIKGFRTVMARGVQYVVPSQQLGLSNSTLLMHPKEMTKYMQHFYYMASIGNNLNFP